MKDNLDKRFLDCYLNLEQKPLPEGVGAAILGLPSDLGITINGGRSGAHLAPKIFREYFNKLTPHPLLPASPSLIDFGDLDFSMTQTMDQVQKLTEEFIDLEVKDQVIPYSQRVPCFVGGGHDFAYPTLKPFLKLVTEPSQVIIINIDGHLDVRSTHLKGVHSGTPFFQLINEFDWLASQFFEWGIQPSSCSSHHYQWLKDKGAHISFADGRGDVFQSWLTEKQSKLKSGQKLKLYLSIDIDAIQASQAPGCSAPASLGVSVSELMNWFKSWFDQVELCYLGVFEVSPALDDKQLTSRLAAQLTHHLLTEQWFQMCKQSK